MKQAQHALPKLQFALETKMHFMAKFLSQALHDLELDQEIPSQEFFETLVPKKRGSRVAIGFGLYSPIYAGRSGVFILTEVCNTLATSKRPVPVNQLWPPIDVNGLGWHT